MTETEMRIAIAEFCGWKVHTGNSPNDLKFSHLHGRRVRTWKDLPRYTNDLNAMHEAVGKLSDKEHCLFREWLVKITNSKEEINEWNRNRVTCYNSRAYISATALQQVEALLRTIGKLKDTTAAP